MSLNVCNIGNDAVFTQINEICLVFCPWVYLIKNVHLLIITVAYSNYVGDFKPILSQ